MTNPLVYLFKKTWKYSEGNRGKVVQFWIMFIIANSIALFAGPLIWAKVIDIVTKQGITRTNIQTLFLLMATTLLIELVFWSLHGPGRVIERVNAFKARINYRKHLLRGVMGLPMEWHVEHHSGDTIDKVEKGTSALFAFSDESFEVIYSLVQLIGSYAMIIYFSRSSAYIVLAMMIITVWITMRFDKVLIDQYKRLNHSENSISESVFDSISNITTVIILRVERLVFKAITRKLEDPMELFRSNTSVNEFKWFLTSTCCTVMMILVMGTYFWQNIGSPQGILVGSVYLLINYLEKISNLFFKFTGMYGTILQQKSKVMNAEELAMDFRDENFANHVLPISWRQLGIKNLSFSYQGENGTVSDLHLKDINMLIRRGEKIALVGETGSGKTTLLKVIRELYRPKELKLTIDGKSAPEGFGGISQAIALVPQSPEIFATTIIGNITLGAEYSLDFVKQFTDMACFTSVAEKLPKGFNTSIKERGVNLSGGQQQRLALSRGLLACHDKEIVLLDEPTSSLDIETEISVYDNIFRCFEKKTIISTIHRLHLLSRFDRVYYFEEGRIIGSGTLKELLSSCGKFRRLWEKSSVARVTS